MLFVKGRRNGDKKVVERNYVQMVGVNLEEKYEEVLDVWNPFSVTELVLGMRNESDKAGIDIIFGYIERLWVRTCERGLSEEK
mmetsp:Transcript_1792/g.3410  ORF Transcript_1792/g.3410 Transcript_1792/m.3410 type:complete len:83 (-) Transcript_1792:1547-1795(-)